MNNYPLFLFRKGCHLCYAFKRWVCTCHALCFQGLGFGRSAAVSLSGTGETEGGKYNTDVMIFHLCFGPLSRAVLDLSPYTTSSAVSSPMIDRWVPVLERGLFQSAAFVPGGDEKERLHWSGLHVIIRVHHLRRKLFRLISQP